jgi:hypothetical protein
MLFAITLEKKLRDLCPVVFLGICGISARSDSPGVIHDIDIARSALASFNNYLLLTCKLECRSCIYCASVKVISPTSCFRTSASLGHGTYLATSESRNDCMIASRSCFTFPMSADMPHVLKMHWF